MGLLKKDAAKKPLVTRGGAGGGSGTEVSPLRPVAVEKLPPCIGACPSGNDIRGWLTTLAQREKLGISLEQALENGWRIEVETNPFPAVMGRVCPHPCEKECNRNVKDSAVGINTVERTLGDWAIEHGLKLTRLDGVGPYAEKIAVVGSGPASLSCAYQLARRGYSVTVFEAFEKAGGMLRYGIPAYRLPRAVLDAEIQRIADLGVEIRCNTTVGQDVTLDDLRRDYAAVFVGIGAHKGRLVGIPGEEGPGVYAGTDFLNGVASGKMPEVGDSVVVIGGGDTAIDAARVSLRLGSDVAGVSRRLGAKVTILYRRTRGEMPAIERDIEEALEEGIEIQFLAAPVRIERNAEGRIEKLIVQRMKLGEPDASGRPRPVPIEGDLYELPVSSVIMAVSQEPDWSKLGSIQVKGSWVKVDDFGRTDIAGVWSGGDSLGLGLATISIGQGRKAAEHIHATLRGLEPTKPMVMPKIGPERIKKDFYEPIPRVQRRIKPAAERLAAPMDEADLGVTLDEGVNEAIRCFSCGLCMGCERCWMYCQVSCFKKLPDRRQGHYYTIDIAKCDGCKKCAEECPCGFLDLV